MDGFLAVDKPAGLTSHDVVSRLRRVLGTRRVGHGGTLDPLATGLLVAAVGKATRLLPYVPLEPKVYEFEVCLGIATNTQDTEGHPVSETDASHLTQQDVEAVFPRFVGSILQLPPMFSAVHHQGERLYALARRGEEVERAPRPVEIKRLEVISFIPGRSASARILCECSGGTYVRTLCHDIGEALAVGGHMTSLRRLQAGIFTMENTVPLADLTAETPLISLRDALGHLDAVKPNPVALEKTLHGNEFRATRPPKSELVCVLDEGDQMVALARWHPPMLHPFLVLA